MDDQISPKTSGRSPMLMVGVVILLVVLVGAFFLFRNKSSSTSQQPQTTTQPTTEVKASPTSAPAMESNVKSFTIEASNFKFSLPEIKVKKGDIVKIHVVNKGGYHDWVLDEFNAKTPRIQADQTADVEFTANKAGTFEYYCSVANHRQMGMKGNLIVE